jgi:hypothetical protein
VLVFLLSRKHIMIMIFHSMIPRLRSVVHGSKAFDLGD